MLRHEYQGGSHFELLSPSGANPLQHWRVVTSSSSATAPAAMRKTYERPLKGFCFVAASSSARLDMPANDKAASAGAGIVQPFLVLQVAAAAAHHLSVDLAVSDYSRARRRLILSTGVRTPAATPLHATIPLADLPRDSWVALVIDLQALVRAYFHGNAFRSLDRISIGPLNGSKIRRIFTVRQLDIQFPLDSNTAAASVQGMPVAMGFPVGVEWSEYVVSARPPAATMNPSQPSAKVLNLQQPPSPAKKVHSNSKATTKPRSNISRASEPSKTNVISKQNSRASTAKGPVKSLLENTSLTFPKSRVETNEDATQTSQHLLSIQHSSPKSSCNQSKSNDGDGQKEKKSPNNAPDVVSNSQSRQSNRSQPPTNNNQPTKVSDNVPQTTLFSSSIQRVYEPSLYISSSIDDLTNLASDTLTKNNVTIESQRPPSNMKETFKYCARSPSSASSSVSSDHSSMGDEAALINRFKSVAFSTHRKSESGSDYSSGSDASSLSSVSSEDEDLEELNAILNGSKNLMSSASKYQTTLDCF